MKEGRNERKKEGRKDGKRCEDEEVGERRESLGGED
jgi:hypothetical protein